MHIFIKINNLIAKSKLDITKKKKAKQKYLLKSIFSQKMKNYFINIKLLFFVL